MRTTTATEALITSHVPWVNRIVGELTARIPGHVDRDELISAGLLALVMTAHAYDEERGIPFTRFAAARLQGALIDALRALDGASRSARRRVRRVNAARDELIALLHRTPTAAELAAFLDMGVRELESAAHEVHQASRLHLEEFSTEAVANLLRDHTPGPEELVLHAELITCMYDAIWHLPARGRWIILGRYFHGRQMTELAAELSISRSRASQLCAQALDRLRTELRARLDTEPPVIRRAPVPRQSCALPCRATTSPSGRARPSSARKAAEDGPVPRPEGRG